jgi:hypothetical protein
LCTLHCPKDYSFAKNNVILSRLRVKLAGFSRLTAYLGVTFYKEILSWLIFQIELTTSMSCDHEIHKSSRKIFNQSKTDFYEKSVTLPSAIQFLIDTQHSPFNLEILFFNVKVFRFDLDSKKYSL